MTELHLLTLQPLPCQPGLIHNYRTLLQVVGIMAPTATTLPTVQQPTKQEEPQASFFIRLLNRINDMVHKPVIEDVVWYIHWATMLLVSPLLLLLMPLVFIWDGITGYFMSTKVISPEGKPILITGCDSGFGYELALKLANSGWIVYAGCLTDAGVNNLSQAGYSSLFPVKMVRTIASPCLTHQLSS